ncbi:hypothetical protein DFH06DRAFT_1358485 [Mycena polygramma]|nr:hypothetical protein DFH06DRAFT_1358485 [Mycena polygramma]
MPTTAKQPSAHASRNPTKPVQQPRARARGALSEAAKASRALKTELRLENDRALEKRFAEIFARREEHIVNLAKEFDRGEGYIRKVLENGARYTGKRAPSLKNAIMHHLSKKARENGEASNVRDLDLTGEDYENFKNSLSEKEKQAFIDELVADKDIKAHGVRATNRAMAMDAQQNSAQIGRVFVDLHTRTDVRGWAMFSRGHPDDPVMPSFVDSGDARLFFQEVLDISYLDVVRRFELWSINRDKAKKARNDIDFLRKDMSERVVTDLVKATGDKRAEMSWTNYLIDIVHRYGVELAGWPSKVPMARPSKIPAEDVRSIHEKLEKGAIHWVVLTNEQRDEVAQEVEALRDSGAGKKQRKTRSDVNKSRGPRKQKAAPNTTDNESTGEPDSDEEDTDADKSDTDADKSDTDDDTDDDTAVPSRASKHVPAVPCNEAMRSRNTTTSTTPASMAATATTTPTAASSAPTTIGATPAFTFPTAPSATSIMPGFPAAPPSIFYAPTMPAAPTSDGSQLAYNAAYDYGFASMDFDLPLDSVGSRAVDDFTNDGQVWRLNTSNREDDSDRDTPSSIPSDARIYGGHSSNAVGSGGMYPPNASYGGEGVYSSNTNYSSATSFNAGSVSVQASVGMQMGSVGAANNAHLLATMGANSSTAPLGPSMSVFRLTSNDTAQTKKRSRDTDTEKRTRKSRTTKSNAKQKSTAKKSTTKKSTTKSKGGDAADGDTEGAPPKRKKQKKAAADTSQD